MMTDATAAFLFYRNLMGGEEGGHTDMQTHGNTDEKHVNADRRHVNTDKAQASTDKTQQNTDRHRKTDIQT